MGIYRHTLVMLPGGGHWTSVGLPLTVQWYSAVVSDYRRRGFALLALGSPTASRHQENAADRTTELTYIINVSNCQYII